jgi:hypothetical protein
MAVSEHVCSRCGHGFCTECVVFPYGLRKPPLCISCALEAGGVRRQHTGRPRFTRRDVRSRLRTHDKEARDLAAQEVPETPVEADDEPQFIGDDSRIEELGGWSQTFPST